MKNYSLSIYRISINRRNSPSEKETLCDFDNGKDLIQILDGMFHSWERQTYKSQPSYDGDDEKRICRIYKCPGGNFEYHNVGRYISGIIESGEYGTEEPIIDSDTGDLKYLKGKDDAPMIPFYFLINIPANSKFGYLILERISNNGIFTLLSQAIQHFTGNIVSGGFVIRIEPFLVQEVFDQNMTYISDAKKIILRNVDYSKTILDKITQNLSAGGPANTDIVIKSGSQGYFNIGWLGDYIKKARKNKRNLYTFQNIECADVAFELKIGDKTRTVSVARLNGLGTNIEITHDLEFGKNGYPTFESLEHQAHILMSYIRDENPEKEG